MGASPGLLEISQGGQFGPLAARNKGILRVTSWNTGALEALQSLALAPRFRGFPMEDLATTDSYLLARKPV